MIDFSNAVALMAARQVESPPGPIMGPISQAFGHVINFLFDFVYNFTAVNSLGIAIVLMTIIFRLLIMPLSLKSQKSMMKLREIQPEIKKLKEKYGNTKDPEKLKKFQQEQSALMSKHGANPLSGCLPMLIPMPLFIGLNIVMRQAAVFITTLRGMYENLAAELLEIPGLVGMHYEEMGIIQQIAEGRVPGVDRIIPEGWMANLEILARDVYARGQFYTADWAHEISNFGNDVILLGLPEHLARVINRFSPYDWALVYEHIPVAYLADIQELVNHINGIERFLGISIVESSGWGLPGVLIPILTGLSMLASTWIMQQRTFDPNADERQMLTQKMLLFIMPVMMAFFTVGLVAAVGVFWITGQIFQIAQDLVLFKKSGTPIRLPFMKPPLEVVDVIPAKKRK